jgi:hypothetical protein
MEAALRTLTADPRIGKIFIEPHLKQRFAPSEAKIRFQGCRAARHDDHIHLIRDAIKAERALHIA